MRPSATTKAHAVVIAVLAAAGAVARTSTRARQCRPPRSGRELEVRPDVGLGGRADRGDSAHPSSRPPKRSVIRLRRFIAHCEVVNLLQFRIRSSVEIALQAPAASRSYRARQLLGTAIATIRTWDLVRFWRWTRTISLEAAPHRSAVEIGGIDCSLNP
jgi:hypothetical protein